jgi:hypothetical protein
MVSVALLALATAQQGDRLVLDGKEYFIHTNPLRAWLAENPGRLPRSEIISTGNWRGYVATWEAKDGQLLLKDIEIMARKENSSRAEYPGSSYGYRSVLSEVFPGQSTIVAEWFTGNIIVPTGEMVQYVHMGYASTYDNYIILRLERGVVVRRWEADLAEFMRFRDAQFAAFKKTPEYKAALAEAISGDSPLSEKEAEEFIRQFYAEEYMSVLFEEPQ